MPKHLLVKYHWLCNTCLCQSTVSAKALCFWAVRLSVWLSVCSSGQILLPWYLMNSLSNLDETYREYTLAPTDDLIRFWRSKIKVTAGCRGGTGIHVEAGESKLVVWGLILSGCLATSCEPFQTWTTVEHSGLAYHYNWKTVNVTSAIFTWHGCRRLSQTCINWTRCGNSTASRQGQEDLEVTSGDGYIR